MTKPGGAHLSAAYHSRKEPEMNQPFGISNCADPEWMNAQLEREEAREDYYCDPDDTDCMYEYDSMEDES